MKIKIGDKAPDFTLVTKNADGVQLVKLNDLIAKSNVVLLFIPFAFTGVCTDQFCDVSGGISAYADLNTTVVGISGDSPFALEAWSKSAAITIPLLSDYEHQVTKDYGIAYDQFMPESNLIMGGVSKRSAFVIDRQGIVRYAESNDSPKVLPNMEAIKAVLADLA